MPTFNERHAQHTLQCMEIWSGNQNTDSAVSTPGLDLWICSRPYHQASAGGDVHYVSLCGGGILTRFILADVAGHGTTVANVARQLRTLMRQNINRKSQERLTRELNRQFAELGQAGRFATAIVGTYLATTRRLTICNAGHPRPLWYRHEVGAWSVLSASAERATPAAPNLPWGIDGTAGYDQTEIPLTHGDFLLFYTDALIEASDPHDQPLGETGLVELVDRIDLSAPENLPGTLMARLNDYRGGRSADDDQTFLLLRHREGKTRRLSLRDKIDVYAKVFGLKQV